MFNDSHYLTVMEKGKIMMQHRKKGLKLREISELEGIPISSLSILLSEYKEYKRLERIPLYMAIADHCDSSREAGQIYTALTKARIFTINDLKIAGRGLRFIKGIGTARMDILRKVFVDLYGGKKYE